MWPEAAGRIQAFVEFFDFKVQLSIKIRVKVRAFSRRELLGAGCCARPGYTDEAQTSLFSELLFFIKYLQLFFGKVNPLIRIIMKSSFLTPQSDTRIKSNVKNRKTKIKPFD